MATLREFLTRHRAEIMLTAYPGESFDGIVDDVFRVSKTERGAGIIACDPRSIIDAVTLAASWPVRIGGDAGAALVITDELGPSNKPRVIAMLTARAKLSILLKFGGLRWVNARCVYSGEKFDARQGEHPHIAEHEDLTLSPAKRGQLAGAYVIGLQKHGLPPVLELMNRDDIDEIRKTWSRELRDGELEDLEHFAQYAMAKAIHRFCDRVPLTDQVRGWLSDLPPRRPESEATVTTPVHDPKAVVDRAARHDTAWRRNPRVPLTHAAL
jgi:hypothetical protein